MKESTRAASRNATGRRRTTTKKQAGGAKKKAGGTKKKKKAGGTKKKRKARGAEKKGGGAERKAGGAKKKGGGAEKPGTGRTNAPDVDSVTYHVWSAGGTQLTVADVARVAVSSPAVQLLGSSGELLAHLDTTFGFVLWRWDVAAAPGPRHSIEPAGDAGVIELAGVASVDTLEPVGGMRIQVLGSELPDLPIAVTVAASTSQLYTVIRDPERTDPPVPLERLEAAVQGDGRVVLVGLRHDVSANAHYLVESADGGSSGWQPLDHHLDAVSLTCGMDGRVLLAGIDRTAPHGQQILLARQAVQGGGFGEWLALDGVLTEISVAVSRDDGQVRLGGMNADGPPFPFYRVFAAPGPDGWGSAFPPWQPVIPFNTEELFLELADLANRNGVAAVGRRSRYGLVGGQLREVTGSFLGRDVARLALVTHEDQTVEAIGLDVGDSPSAAWRSSDITRDVWRPLGVDLVDVAAVTSADDETRLFGLRQILGTIHVVERDRKGRWNDVT